MEEQINQNKTSEQNTNPAPAPTDSKPASSDAEANKVMAVIGYIFPFLFFIPLLNEASKNSPFARFHANQQLLLLIVAVIIDIVGPVIPVLGRAIILPIGSVFISVLAIVGIVGAVKDKMNPLPIIGGYKII